jgi:sugar diacid utilization regulator
MAARGRRGKADTRSEDAWLLSVSEASARDAGVPAQLLGDYLSMLATATVAGRRPHPRELDAVGALGRLAAEQGFPTRSVVNLYLSAAWRLWRQLPKISRSDDSEVVRAAAEAVLRVVDDAVAALVEGYQTAQRRLIRREVSLRRELVDDLIRGDADVAGLLERAEPFGLDLGRAHVITLAAPSKRLPDSLVAVSSVERMVLDHFGDRDVLVATKDGMLVVLSPETTSSIRGQASAGDLAELVHAQLDQLPAGSPWRVASGRPYSGAYGVARSYEEAREAIALADRLKLNAPIVHARDFLVYRVLVRDHVAIRDLVQEVLSPLLEARGGAVPLLDTLEAYFATGEVATDTARRLHLSVRAVTYRLGRVKQITGRDPADPTDRFTLYTAVLGARLLGWPNADALTG